MTSGENAVSLFGAYAALAQTERAAFVLEHPALLSKEALAVLHAAPHDNGASTTALDQLSAFRGALDGGQPYPLGTGPIEAAWEALGRGEISFDEAQRRATRAEVTLPIAYPYVRALSRYALSIAAKRTSHALRLATLLLGAAEAAPETPESILARVRAGMDFLVVATPNLVDIPDGRVYARAMNLGKWLATRPERLTMWPPGELAFRIGVLNLDPYLLGGDVANYARSLNAWQNRLVQHLGPTAASIPSAELAMPEPLAALTIAAKSLSEAVATQTGDSIAAAQKALTQARALFVALGGAPAALPEAGAPGALPESLATASDPSAALVAIAAAFDAGRLDAARTERLLLSLDAPEALLARITPERSVQAVLDAMLLNSRIGSSNGLAFAERYRELVFTNGSPDARKQFWGLELALLATDPSASQLGSPSALVRSVPEAQREHREADVITALDRLDETFPALTAAHSGALQYLRFLLIAGLATNAIASEQWTDAIVNDGIALSYCLAQGFNDDALTFATRIDDLGSHDGPGIDAALATVVTACSLRFEAAFGDTALRLIRSICTKAVVGMLRSPELNARAYGTLMLAGTGTRLGAALRAGVQVTAEDDPPSKSLLSRIAAIERETGPQLQTELNEELLLASLSVAEEREDGADASQRLRNLQSAFDARIASIMASRAADRRPEPFTLEALRESLDDRTVVLQYFLGSSPDGRIATMVLLVTKDDAAATCIVEEFPAGLLEIDVGNGLKALTQPLGFSIQERRAQVYKAPGARLVDRDGGAGLAFDRRRLLGPFVERLAALHAAGKTKLTIVPNGPLHFYPWALLGGTAQPLGADWAISIAPSLGFLLGRNVESVTPIKTERTVIGLSFPNANRLGLPPIPASATEAAAVAAVLGVAPLLEEAATKSATLAALRRSRFAHISSHGRIAVDAGFQTIFLADDGGEDAGRLRAYEILAEDFRGLELLTLSACYTALGRFDLGDNLSGLPAAFFLAGVRTVVATLWQVRAIATAAFFPAFYTAIESGVSHSDAFGIAQAKTRASLPQFRDWGAFFLMGG